MIKVLALDLEGTLISNAVSQIARPHLYEFLTRCDELVRRLVMFTTVEEFRFRAIASSLVKEKVAPRWFAEIEYIHWSGEYKDLSFISNSLLEEILLVDDYEGYIHPDQKNRWIFIPQFSHPYSSTDNELLNLLNPLFSTSSD